MQQIIVLQFYNNPSNLLRPPCRSLEAPTLKTTDLDYRPGWKHVQNLSSYSLYPLAMVTVQ